MYLLSFYQKKKFCIVVVAFILLGILLLARLFVLSIAYSGKLGASALEIEQRERSIKAARGLIYDRNGKILADNKTVCTISVIHSQIEDVEAVIGCLADHLQMDEAEVRKKVEKVSSREKIKSNVDKEIGDRIRQAGLAGIKVDEDYKRYYPFDTLASKVLGFTGADNQGIVGLEAKYDEILQGENGSILTLTDYRGIEIENAAEARLDPVSGNNLYLTMDYTIQCYVSQIADRVMRQKNAKSVSVLLMNPQNGEMYAMVNLPEYHLNDPYTLDETNTLVQAFIKKREEVRREAEESTKAEESTSQKSEQISTIDLLNVMWRNTVISDSYEPGSTFKIVTATAALEEEKVTVEDLFYCPGYKMVEDRKIRCHKTQGHGSETFREGIMNSCNPVFMEIGARVGSKRMLDYYKKLGLYEVTGIDLPGEANSIMHKLDDIGNVELATMSFGQSIQITPLQLMRAVSAVVNGGHLVTPHFAKVVEDSETGKKSECEYAVSDHAVTEKTSQTMRDLLEAVVAEGTGHNGAVEGWRIGGKTATSEKLPRGNGKYISSFLAFAPAEQPYVMGLILIDEPEGLYYGGTIAAPIMGEIMENVLPYLDKVSK